ncbi:hypothetical protein [Gluconobacter morbifer]|uniref:hypothetical protein n=1 Tax=Gluconobacter morbifer TaxID=479935 RepID=UPI00031E54F8|nr:hypothetical protein [Gluconobacter morbifer]
MSQIMAPVSSQDLAKPGITSLEIQQHSTERFQDFLESYTHSKPVASPARQVEQHAKVEHAVTPSTQKKLSTVAIKQGDMKSTQNVQQKPNLPLAKTANPSLMHDVRRVSSEQEPQMNGKTALRAQQSGNGRVGDSGSSIAPVRTGGQSVQSKTMQKNVAIKSTEREQNLPEISKIKNCSSDERVLQNQGPVTVDDASTVTGNEQNECSVTSDRGYDAESPSPENLLSSSVQKYYDKETNNVIQDITVPEAGSPKVSEDSSPLENPTKGKIPKNNLTTQEAKTGDNEHLNSCQSSVDIYKNREKTITIFEMNMGKIGKIHIKIDGNDFHNNIHVNVINQDIFDKMQSGHSDLISSLTQSSTPLASMQSDAMADVTLHFSSSLLSDLPLKNSAMIPKQKGTVASEERGDTLATNSKNGTYRRTFLPSAIDLTV